MLWPLNETLALIEPYLPHELVPPQTFSNGKAVAQILPNAMASYYLECRLVADADQVDFLTCLTGSSGGHNILAGQGPAADLPPCLLEDRVWRRIRDFYTHWVETSSPLHAQIPMTWLEFDHIDQSPSQIPLPSFSLCLDSDYEWNALQPQHVNHLSAPRYRQISWNAFELLLGNPLSTQTKQSLFSCFELLPPGGQIIHLSAMLARQPVALKIYGSIPKDYLLRYLTQINWPGSVTELQSILDMYYTPDTTDQNVYIDISIEDRVMAKLGLAFAQQQIPTLPDPDPRRSLLLDRLVETGLCTSDKRSALHAWPGRSTEASQATSRPTRLSRWLDIKCIYQPNQPLEAKGYLGFMPYFSLF